VSIGAEKLCWRREKKDERLAAEDDSEGGGSDFLVVWKGKSGRAMSKNQYQRLISASLEGADSPKKYHSSLNFAKLVSAFDESEGTSATRFFSFPDLRRATQDPNVDSLLTVTRVQLPLMLHDRKQVPNHLLSRPSDHRLISSPTSLNRCCCVGSEVNLGGEADGSIDLGGLGGGRGVFESLRESKRKRCEKMRRRERGDGQFMRKTRDEIEREEEEARTRLRSGDEP